MNQQSDNGNQTSTAPRDLETLQRWMQAVIMHPDGVQAGVESDSARTLIDVAAADVESVVNRSTQRTSIERLEVYGNAYFARLLECLASEFPSLEYMLTEDVFSGFAFGYLQDYPSQSYTLSDLSARFPKYLKKTRPDDVERPGWPDLMYDLAVLERAYAEVFDGPGPESEELLKPEDLAAIPPEQFGDVVLEPVGCLQLLAFDFPVHEYKTAFNKGQEPEMPAARPCWLAVTRVRYVVRRWPLSHVEYELLTAVCEGEPLGEAISRAVDAADVDFDTFAGNLRDWFEEWTAAGFFRSVRVLELP